MKAYLILIMAFLIAGCSQQNSDEEPGAETKEKSAGKQAVERMTGQTAVQAYKHTKDVLVDVEASTEVRTQSVKDLNKE